MTTVGDFKFFLADQEEYNEESSGSIDCGSGQKLWECSIDLCLALQIMDLSSFHSVLELGCGHGLPGLICLANSTAQVSFHDYQESTIRCITQVNVDRNFADLSGRCRFVSGSWSDFDCSVKYDLILCSEGIYSEEHFESLANILKRCLSQTGLALFAGKKYYFGCGGGTMAFVSYLGENFKAEVLKKVEDRRSNIREILSIRWRND